MAGKEVSWLLVGLGAIAGKRVASALSDAAAARLVGVCDVVPERVEEFADEYGVAETYTDLDRALRQTSAEAVYLATPVSLHSSMAVQVLESGRHVLVEKPLGLSAHDAKLAVQAAKSKRLRAGCAYYRRCFPCFQHAKNMLDNGEFGQIVLVRLTYFSWSNPSPEDPQAYWRVVKARSGGGPVADMGSHMFDVLIGLLGTPTRVCARIKTLVHAYEVEDSAVAFMELQNGADVICSFHWNSRTWSHEFEIIGTEAKVKWHPYDSGKVIKTVGRDICELELANAPNVHQPLIEDFVQAVTDDRDPVVPLREALKTNTVIDAVYESANSGAEVTIPQEGY